MELRLGKEHTLSFIYDTTGSLASTVGFYNPLRYRGYVYDVETKLYYVTSRYYNPEMGRFLNADTTAILTATPMGVTDKNLFAYCDNNPVMRVDHGGNFWNVIAGAVVGGAINLITSVVSELDDGKITLKEAGQIAISTAIGMAEGAAIAIYPTASAAISAASSGIDTAINGILDHEPVGDVITNSLVSGVIDAVARSGGSDFVKGGKLINNAAGSIGNTFRKGVHPVVKKSARKNAKAAMKYIRRTYISGQIESLAFDGISKFSSYYCRSLINSYRGR